MPVEIIPAAPEHAEAAGRIFYHAFKELMDRHQLELDIPSQEVGIQVMAARIPDPGFTGFVALVDGIVAGANFYSRMDPVAGVGPLVVSPAHQGLGLGRRLMQTVVDHALAHHGPQVRLVQDAINMTSLSLYTSIGFTVQEPLVLLYTDRDHSLAPGIRPLTPADLDTCAQLSAERYRASRINEIATMIQHGPAMGVVPVGLERGGHLSGYAVPGFFGHGIAETPGDLLSLIQAGAALSSHPLTTRWLCPSRQGDLYRLALQNKHRASRALHTMTIGPYQSPSASWFCSIEY